jgi:hypothetical protein
VIVDHCAFRASTKNFAARRFVRVARRPIPSLLKQYPTKRCYLDQHEQTNEVMSIRQCLKDLMSLRSLRSLRRLLYGIDPFSASGLTRRQWPAKHAFPASDVIRSVFESVLHSRRLLCFTAFTSACGGRANIQSTSSISRPRARNSQRSPESGR